MTKTEKLSPIRDENNVNNSCHKLKRKIRKEENTKQKNMISYRTQRTNLLEVKVKANCRI